VQLTGTATGDVTVSSVSPVPGGSGTVTFTLGTSPAATPGSTLVTITGTSNGFSSTLEVTVNLTEGFTLSADPATFFLGNPSPLVVRIQRGAGFQGSVNVQLGALPTSIASAQPSSIVAPTGTNAVTFQITAAVDPNLSGQTVSIPVTGSIVPGSSPVRFSQSMGGNSANLVSIAASGILQAPFSVTAPNGTSLGSIQVGQTATALVQVNFLGTPVVFPSPVQVSGEGTAEVTLLSSPLQLTASGAASAVFSPLTAGLFSLKVVSQAGNFQVITTFRMNAFVPAPPPPPANPFSLSVFPSGVQQVNANVPVVVQVQVVPLDTGFAEPVVIEVTDGAQMQYDSVCGNPPGFQSYTGSPGVPGVLSFVISPPFSTATNFCMSAGQGVESTINSGPDSVSIQGTAVTGFFPNEVIHIVTVTHDFQIGVPNLVVSRVSTFNIPLGGSVQAQINLNAISGFNLPVHVHLTGSGSFISTSGPIQQPFPTGVASVDCGPEPSSTGKDVSPGGSITCTISNTSTSGFPSPVDIEVFGVFPITNPGSAVSAFFQVCLLDSGATFAGCGADIQGGGAQSFSKASIDADSPVADSSGLTIASSSVQFSPFAPKEGDPVRIRAEVENGGSSEARNVEVSLVVNKQVVATVTVDVPAGGSRRVEFEWEAFYDPRLSVAIAVEPEDGSPQQIVAVRNLFVEPSFAAALHQGRSLVSVRNRECAGFRFLAGVQSFCGGSSDFELNPTITGQGQLLVQILALNGGIVDLGPQPITGVLTVPAAGYQTRALLEGGHLYAVESHGKYGLLYVARIHSDVDPRLARLEGGSGPEPALGSLENLVPDQLGALLDQSLITVDFQWAYREDGSRQFQYGFAGGGRIPQPSVYRQPRVPAQGTAQQ